MTKILLVEDETPLRDTLESGFKDEFEVLTASDGVSGLKLALTHRPDMILLDLKMPKMDGITMLEELRRDEWGREVPVIILTNLTDSQNISKGINNRILKYYIKSDWRLDDLSRDVKGVLEKYKKTYESDKNKE